MAIEGARERLALIWHLSYEESPTVEALVANDLEFHRRIALGTGNPVLCSLIDSTSPISRLV